MAYTDNPNGFICVGALDGSPTVETRWARLAQSTNVKVGDFLVISSGYLSIALATSTVLVGLCQADVTGASGVYPWIPYIPALPNVVFEGQCSGTPTIANLWTVCDIEGTTGIMEINEDVTTYGVIVPFELVDETEGFGLNARLRFVVKKSIWNISA